ncbi:MAG TPA: hypothetical protein VFO10_02735 [Oligoflexus sp.]|uniref:hypothetical protein n=1 Tax=Oligoflexus sp. TaxID=1971216 RepID=UPI002D7FDC97|nr:hypothetical protein [Oligoflexus sp.]HET9236138.1 hypothetical protein [Oligoflexus sp.]
MKGFTGWTSHLWCLPFRTLPSGLAQQATGLLVALDNARGAGLCPAITEACQAASIYWYWYRQQFMLVLRRWSSERFINGISKLPYAAQKTIAQDIVFAVILWQGKLTSKEAQCISP